MCQIAMIGARGARAAVVVAVLPAAMAIGRPAHARLQAGAAQPPSGGSQAPGEIQQPKGQWQTPGEIRAPTGAWQKPGEIQVPTGIQAIHAEKATCEERLTTVADALFEFDKATLNADAEQTLAVLGPQITQRGKHPVVIEGHTDAIGSDAHNRKRPLNGTYRWSARSASLLCQEVRHGREEGEHEATESKRVAGLVVEAG